MNSPTRRHRTPRPSLLGLVCLLLLLVPGAAKGQLFENLKSLSQRLPVGDPSIPDPVRGPKGIAAADFNGDGLGDFAVSDKNGSITLYLSRGEAGFAPPIYLQAGAGELRGIVAGDFNGDGRPDIATAAPFEGVVHLFLNDGNGSFHDRPFSSWLGGRDLATGDFDGDGRLDLVVAGPKMGLVQYQGLGDGTFAVVRSFLELDSVACGDSSDFPQPAYFLQSFRLPGRRMDSLVAAHGEGCDHLWVFTPGADGVLAITGELKNIDVNALAVGNVLHPIGQGPPELVTASLNLGYLEVRRFDPTLGSFEPAASLQIPVEGGPRSIRLVDWDRDGWNDLVVVIRFVDKVTLFLNQAGTLHPGASLGVGRLPRELEIADFNGDGSPDLAIVNRYSLDVTVIDGFPGKATFAALDQVYPVDGTVSGLDVRDYNKDGYSDVVQLHLASAELSVRLSDTNGLLSPPTFFPLGTHPTAQAVSDVNNDGKPDIVAVDLGGSISVRLGLGDGAFGPEQVYTLPPHLRGGLFALVAADFDNDGNVDLAAGFVDCRLVFLKGHGDGTFSVAADYDHPLTFTYEARSMAAADFDGDGELDLVGAGLDGRISVVENRGDLLTTHQLRIRNFESPGLTEIRSIQVLDENHDGDWDLFVSGPKGSAIFLGGPGLSFTLKEATRFDAEGAGTTTAVGDFDGDGNPDLVVANADSKTLTVFVRKDAAAEWEPALVVGVPSATFIATGDLDGDGKPDLVGTGDVLWTALSSRRSRIVSLEGGGGGTHSRESHPVINELLASNASLPVAADGGRFSDWVEIFNGGTGPEALAGWTLQLVTTNAAGSAGTNAFVLPATSVVTSGGHLLLVAADKKRTPLHMGYTLPAEGGCLELLNPQGQLVDRVVYPGQSTDQSYGRFRDGSAGWVMNPYPSPNRANQDNGTLDPEVRFDGIDPESLLAGKAPRFRAHGRDDLGITTMALFWTRLDIPDDGEHRTILFDDGMHNDGATQDGTFVGAFDKPLPPGARIQFYLAATDLTDKTIYLPAKPERELSVVDPTLYTLAVGGERPTLEISEVVSDNQGGLKDELGGTPDWVEIRNYGLEPVSLDGVHLGRALFEKPGERYNFPKGSRIAPGEHLVVFCDAQSQQSQWHAPFSLSSKGDGLFLSGTREPGGETTLIDGIRFDALPANQSWARLGINGAWGLHSPTPRGDNWPGLWVGSVRGGVQIALQTEPGAGYVIESTQTLQPGIWAPVAGNRRDGGPDPGLERLG